MEQKIKDRIATLIIGFAALLLVFGGYGLINYYVNIPEQPQVDPVIDETKIGELMLNSKDVFDRYLSYKNVNIYSNGLVTPSSLIGACLDRKKVFESCNEEIAKITKVVVTSGEIKDAYLYLKMAVSRNNMPLSPLTMYDSVWFYVDESNYGGHLLRSDALINQRSEDGFTELLFDLKKIPFTNIPYNDSNVANRVKNILKDKLDFSGKHFIGAFVSTLGYGKIVEMRIGYNGGSIEIR